MHGPNVTKLIIVFSSRRAIPVGGGIADGLKFFQDQEHRHQIMSLAESDAAQAIALIKSAPDNQWGDDDEVIAGEILKAIDEKKAQTKSNLQARAK